MRTLSTTTLLFCCSAKQAHFFRKATKRWSRSKFAGSGSPFTKVEPTVALGKRALQPM